MNWPELSACMAYQSINLVPLPIMPNALRERTKLPLIFWSEKWELISRNNFNTIVLVPRCMCVSIFSCVFWGLNLGVSLWHDRSLGFLLIAGGKLEIWEPKNKACKQLTESIGSRPRLSGSTSHDFTDAMGLSDVFLVRIYIKFCIAVFAVLFFLDSC